MIAGFFECSRTVFANSDRNLRTVFAIRESRQSNNLAPIDEILSDAMDRMEARMAGKGQEGTVETGFTDLDQMTGGLHASELVILAARPSMGKTAFAMNIAENVKNPIFQKYVWLFACFGGVF